MVKREYKDWIKSVFIRDDYTCLVCGKKGGCLHTHHILSYAEYPKFRLNPNNGITLCVECHREVHHG